MVFVNIYIDCYSDIYFTWSDVKDVAESSVFSYQNLSPNLRSSNVCLMRQAKVGPTLMPASELSVTPPL